MELPKEFKGELYFYQNVKWGYTTVFTHGDMADDEYVRLGSVSVDVSFDTDNAKKGAITALEKQIEATQAEAHKRVSYLQEQINSLKAIEYQQ